jgi:hypothetical protein
VIKEGDEQKAIWDFRRIGENVLAQMTVKTIPKSYYAMKSFQKVHTCMILVAETQVWPEKAYFS